MALAITGWLCIGRSCAAGGSWPYQRQVNQFACYADFDLARIEGDFRRLRTLPNELFQELGLSPPERVIHIFLLQREPTYRHYVASVAPTAVDRRAVFVDHRGTLMVFARVHPELAVDLRHECTHALLHATLPLVPLWLDEGLAEYFEEVDQRPLRNRDDWIAVQSRLARGEFPTLQAMERLTDLRQMGIADYQNAWGWVEFLLHGPREARASLIRYLHDLERHNVPVVLSRSLPQHVPNWTGSLHAHFIQPRVSAGTGPVRRN